MSTIRGYDFDGVITHGVKPIGRAYIITGRSHEQAAHTYRQLENLQINCAIYFHPCSRNDITKGNTIEWKKDMIKLLDIDIFYEDDIEQVVLLKELLPHVEIRHVVTE